MQSQPARRGQGCRTCKKRKIGCDKAFPACNNCVRTGRECLGYGLRLVWPDEPDGRRKSAALPGLPATAAQPPNGGDGLAAGAVQQVGEGYGKQFLNVTHGDVATARAASGFRGAVLDGRTLVPSRGRPQPSLSMLSGVRERESVLLDYYQKRLSVMISTIDIDNGFREALLPMALAGASSDASDGLLNAILALSAFHLSGADEARPYKAKALRSLSTSLSSQSGQTADTGKAQLASSMMLCVYNVFDETEGNWHLHNNGARNMLQHLVACQGLDDRTAAFLYTWFLYHDVLGAFSQPLRAGPELASPLWFGPNFPINRSTIVGSLGCSVEVMEVISYVNKVRATELRQGPPGSPKERLKRNEEWHRVESQLLNLQQRLEPAYEEQIPVRERTRILNTAELYRIATLLYLHRTCSKTPGQEMRVMYLDQAFSVLKSLETCTSPWPLFVIACETTTDEQRIEILRTLDLMDDRRRIGNVFVLRNIIESFWKQLDLQADHDGPSTPPKWWEVVDLNTAAPWFI